MAIVSEKTIIVESPMDLEAEMCRYNSKTREELEDTLWFDYGVTLVVVAYEHSL